MNISNRQKDTYIHLVRDFLLSDLDKIHEKNQETCQASKDAKNGLSLKQTTNQAMRSTTFERKEFSYLKIFNGLLSAVSAPNGFVGQVHATKALISFLQKTALDEDIQVFMKTLKHFESDSLAYHQATVDLSDLAKSDSGSILGNQFEVWTNKNNAVAGFRFNNQFFPPQNRAAVKRNCQVQRCFVQAPTRVEWTGAVSCKCPSCQVETSAGGCYQSIRDDGAIDGYEVRLVNFEVRYP